MRAQAVKALVETLGAELVTADRRFARRAAERYPDIRILGAA